MPDSGTTNLGSIISDGLYRIPNYQRGYAWTSTEVNALLDDVEYVTENEAVDSHYLNSIIVTSQRGATEAADIIDGQQRTITSCLVAHEILRKATELSIEDNPNTTRLRQNIEEKLSNLVFKYSATTVQYRVLPADEHQSIFKELVPDDLEADRDLDEISSQAESPSEQKLVEAVETIVGRLDEFLESSAEGQSIDGVHHDLIYLDRLASTLHEDFTATLHEVDSSSEAGRIFEAINDRGRDLNRADKIKSYLVYRVTLGDIDLDVEEIHETFTQIYEVLNEYASDPGNVDGLVDRLVSQHWNMFAGEDAISNSDHLEGRHEKASDDLNQIKHGNYHVPKDADDSRVERWIEVYLSSLKEAANAYVLFRGVDQEELFEELSRRFSDEVDKNAVRHYLYAVERFGPSTTHSLLIALYIRFVDEDTDSFEPIAEALEKLVFRIFAIGGARRDTKRNDFESLSRVLFWKGRNDITDVFPEGSSIPTSVDRDASQYGIDGTPEDAEQVTNLIENLAHDYSHETEDGSEIDIFERRLRKDNLDGLGVAGWGGVNTSEIKNYMLYRYEVELRSGGAGLPNYLQARIFDYTIEHVWPQNRSEEQIAPHLDDDEYAHYVERLGNLAILSLSENSSAGNNPYQVKWKRTYENAGDGTKMFRDEFPNPIEDSSNLAAQQGFDDWNKEVIEWRSKRMAEELATYWSCSD
jgi:hypothetical protein